MKPILYPPEEREFKSNGLGVLSDAISCVVTWEGNGIFDLTMEYPMDGIHFDKIADRCIIMAIPTPYRGPQPFRVVDVLKHMDGTATITANHVAYDLAGKPLNPFSAGNASTAMAGLASNAEVDPGFTFWTDKATTAAFNVPLPTSIWSVLGGSEGSILDVYGGQYEFDRWVVKLHDQLGQDNGVVIRYGKNMTDLEQERNLAKMYTGVYPYWADTEGALVVCNPKIVPIAGNFNYTNILTLDLSDEWQEAPTPEQLKTRTERYIKDNKLGEPTVSITVSHEMLEQTDEYAGLSLLERCSVFDTVHVQFEELGVDVTASIASAETDVLRERYNSLKVGSVQANIADTIANQQQQIDETPDVSTVQQIANSITQAILGAKGGSVRLIDTNGDGEPDTLYIADNPDPAKAVKVWRFNYEGWGASSNGYNGPFEMSAALGVGMYADFLAAGTLDAALVKVINLIADHVQSRSGKYLMELWAAVLTLLDGSNLRTRLYTTGSENSIGVLQVFSGQVDENGTMSSGAMRSQIQPDYIECGADGNGNYNGSIKTGSVTTSALKMPMQNGASFNALSESDGSLIIGNVGKFYVGGTGGNVEWKIVSIPGGGTAYALCIS